MKKVEMPVGTKVRGYGLLNEYGEFEFTPEQTGIRQGETKLIHGNEDYTLTETKKLIVIHFRVAKGDRMSILKKFTQLINLVFLDLQKYEF